MCATWDASAEAERAFGSFQRSTVEAMKVLAEAGLYTQLMMIMYGAIDAAGLLDAPLGTIDADGETFRDWVDKYMIPGARLQASAADLWGARCALLHAYGAESKLSRNAKVREVAAYWSSSDPSIAQARCDEVKRMTGREVVPVELGALIEAFGAGFAQFASDFAGKCRADKRWEGRARKLVAHYRIPG
ncbi:MAG: hypothetical protein K1X67_14695 [Fimbriimonadaceae bacterium]|nr:hypothetical protein [Fimbriimonadaceae bacterium]